MTKEHWTPFKDGFAVMNEAPMPLRREVWDTLDAMVPIFTLEATFKFAANYLDGVTANLAMFGDEVTQVERDATERVLRWVRKWQDRHAHDYAELLREEAKARTA